MSDTIQMVVQLISNVGFPIAMCLILLWYVNKVTDQHKDEMKNVIQCLDNNTKAIEKLSDKVEKLNG